MNLPGSSKSLYPVNRSWIAPDYARGMLHQTFGIRAYSEAIQAILPTPHEGEIKREIKYLKTN